MKLLKRITAVMAALLIVVNIVVVNIFAAMSAPVAAGSFILFLTALLSAGGHSQIEINSMDVTQMQSTVVQDFNTGRITSDTILTDPFSGENIDAMNYLCYHEFYDFRDNTNAAINDFVSDLIYSWESDKELGINIIASYFKPTSTIDVIGGGVRVDRYKDGKLVEVYVSDYVLIDTEINYFSYFLNDGSSNSSAFYRVLNDGTLHYVSSFTQNSWVPISMEGYTYKFYGDVRYLDGTQAPTDDEYAYELGETEDGTKVTLDMLNPDGTVTIDGVTYYPADYLNPDKLTDKGKDALLAALLAALANTYVKSEDKPIVDTDEIVVEVAEEFQDYAVPIGIANVFPFCIPWDIVRGFQLLNRPVVIPKFEIPFNIPEFGIFPGVEKSITLDFSEYDKYIQIFRWFQIIGFSFLLCRLSLTRVKGAGA